MKNFYPRPPRGGRLMTIWALQRRTIFLSTPSARRATFASMRCAVRASNFYPRPPRGGRPKPQDAGLSPAGFLSTPSARRATLSVAYQKAIAGNFYPRPPRGGRRCRQRRSAFLVKFLSTPSARRATKFAMLGDQSGIISIHALREEGDPFCGLLLCEVWISIHALREEGDKIPFGDADCIPQFLSTPSARRATAAPR